MKWYMQRLELLENIPAFSYLQPWQQQLVRLSFTLWQREYHTGSAFMDYSFLVFPMAKAYEGFLKNFLRDSGLISEGLYVSRRFRIGRAINPDVRLDNRDEAWLYDDIVKLCGPGLSRKMWEAWLTCRNRVFHYFPGRDERLTLEQAGRYIEQIFEVMQEVVACQNQSGTYTTRQ